MANPHLKPERPINITQACTSNACHQKPVSAYSPVISWFMSKTMKSVSPDSNPVVVAVSAKASPICTWKMLFLAAPAKVALPVLGCID
ncbi:hypothetical protein ACL1HM_13005 [Corynebacterium striatum]